MSQGKPWHLGVIEGFFGRPWSWQARSDYADFLCRHGFSAYVYAPKSDDSLRKHWKTPFSDKHLQQLGDLRSRYQQQSLAFGIGLSPLNLFREYSSANKALLRAKLEQINEIHPSLLCILFDDMHGDLESLADTQLAIVDLITSFSNADAFIVCPTYYSSDPALARLFGSPPDQYLANLGTGLDPAIDIFWTGPKVISSEYPAEHMLQVAEQLRRKPVLWDNYPVNDAARLAPFLHLLPFSGRDPQLRGLCAGHMANPMNQAWLSQLPLFTLQLVYTLGAHDTLLGQACAALCPPELAAALQEDAEIFQHSGLGAFDEVETRRYLRKYTELGDHPMAREVIEWLQGEYAFDPACLT